MDFSSYRFSYLRSIICSSIVSTTVICSILASPCFSDSTLTGSNSNSIFVSSSSSSPYSQDRQHSSSKHHYYLKHQRKTQALTYWNQQAGSWSFASSHNSVTYYNRRSSRNSRRRSLYNIAFSLSQIYGSNDAEDGLRAADPGNYDAQRVIFLRYEQRPQRSRVLDLRSRSQRWIVESLFRSHAPLDRDDNYDDKWDEMEEEDEYEDGDYDIREEQNQDHEETEFDNRIAEEAKDKERHALNAILRPASTSSCPWIPQLTWITRKHYNHLQQQQGRCRFRRLYPKRDLLVDSQPHQQQEQLSRQPISHKQLPPRSWTRMARTARTWRLDSQYPQRPDRQQQRSHPHNKHNRQNKHLHTAGGRHPRRSRNGRRTSSLKYFSSACTSFINRVLSLSSPPLSFLSTITEHHRILVDYLSDPLRLAKSSKGAMDALLYFLSDLPNGLSPLFHQDFASALFSTAPPNTSKRLSHQHQHHASSTTWFSTYNPYGSNNVHGPQRIPPHPLLEMAASNILIRLGLLLVLCLGAFYYCVTTMEQQQRQIAGTDGGAGSNWLADPVPASSAVATNSISTTAPTAGAPTTTGSNISLGSTTSEGGATNTLMTPGVTAAEVMASLGRSVNNLEQLHRQQLQQQSADGQLLNLSLVNERHTSFESTDSATTPSTPASVTATIISALLRSTATAISLTCGTDSHLQLHLSPYSASTTPAIPCSNVFSGPESNKVADDKSGFEPGWKGYVKKDVDTESQAKMKDTSQPAHKDKQKDLHNSDDDKGIYQSEQEFGHFSTAGPFDTEDDSWREYRNMMYYSSNYPPPYSATFGSGGGESSRSNSRRSSIFASSPSPPALVPDQIALATTIVISHTNEEQGLTEVEEEEPELPFWTHFYTLDALQSTICQRLAAATRTPPTFLSHHQKSHGLYSSPSPRQKQDRAKGRRQIRTARRAILNRSPSLPSPSSTSTSASTSSPSSSGSVSASIISAPTTTSTTRSTFSPRRRRARAMRQQRLLQ